jgi:signal transduction histidine kinase
MFAVLMVLQWLGGIAAALWISPRTWVGSTSYIHIHVWAAALLGGLIVAFPIILALTHPGRTLTRHAIAIAQMLEAALLIHLTGGRIESHFQLFGLLAFLALYLDWRVMATATFVVATEHLVRGLLWPESVYGILTPSLWRWVEHAGWILFEDTFLLIAIARTRKEMFSMAQRSAQLESSKSGVERKIRQRTAQLTTEIAARKQQEAALALACEAARGAARTKAEFLANMSHEIRTPMTAVIGYADLLLDPQTPESERITHVQTIRRNGEHLLGLINDILDLSKVEAGQMTIEKVACSPSGLIVDVVSLMRVRAK